MSATPANSFPFRLEFPPELPISARAQEITDAIQANPVVILAGETGSGKSTQIPKMCLAAGRGGAGRIACTQPRRVAALSVSRRVADELGVEWGREVGAKIRFTDQTTAQTIVKFLTDGMLLAEVQGDPLLREYDTIVIDEAHERSLNIDFLLGHLRTLRYKRPELRIIITSATIDTALFSAAFEDAPVIQVEGRTFPVEVIYSPLDEMGSDAAEGDERESRAEALHYIDGAVEAVDRIVHESTSGDILVFLPSERDIREVRDLLEGRLKARETELVPLFGRLSNAEQQRVFAPTQHRKIVLATNIAETSLTIPGIRFVVDTGLARISRYSPQARTRRLPIEPVSQSSADQRKGRSGRVADGVCIRLYSEKDYLERPRFTQPEIQRANLADVILRMKAFGLGDIERFPFINQPATKSIRAGYALLEELGAMEEARADAGEEKADEALRRGQAAPPSIEPPAIGDRRSPVGGEKDKEKENEKDLGYTRTLTPVGRELARLPVDPTVGRMILQARTEKALRELLVIASGLSIQDPRERPLDQQQAADTAHRRFRHPDSDFLTLLNIWEAYHDEFENLSQAKLRRFCREHFLSYIRMREWRDIHAQLEDVLREREDFKLTSAFHGLKTIDEKSTAFGTPAYRAIHRSILAGLLGNIAHYDEENQNYKATHDRRVALFPGSVLFQRDDAKKRQNDASQRDAQKKPSKTAARWIMAAEIMETSRLYARTCARLDPAWALELGAHVVRVAHSEPFWQESAGRVLVKQRTRLYGLEIDARSVGYGKINPRHATEIFIREALVADTVTFPLDFITHNRRVRENVEAILTRTRDAGYLNLDEAAYRFYAHHLIGDDLPPVSAVPELVDLVRERRGAQPRFLFLEPDDLRDPDALAHDAESFPPSLPLDNRALPLNYTYKPGESDDGVTLDVHIREADTLTPAALDWAVPGHIEPKVEHYLRALPKELRRAFVPLAESAKMLSARIASRDRLTGRRETVAESLAAQIAEQYRVAIDPALWAAKPPPDHLRVRVRVLDDDGKEICSSRELAEISAALHAQTHGAAASVAKAEPELWRRARAQQEKPPATTWAFGDIPHRVLVTEQAGVPVFAFPGLKSEPEGVALRLFKTAEEAQAATAGGLTALLEATLGRDLGWLERDLRDLRSLGALTATLAPIEDLQTDAIAMLRRWLTDPRRVLSASGNGSRQEAHDGARGGRDDRRTLTEDKFAAALEKARGDLRGLVPKLVDLLREILALRQALQVHPQPYPGLERELAALLPANFLAATPYPQLGHFPRYLRAMKLRAERWRQNPAKDAERAAQLGPYVAAATKLLADARAAESGRGSGAKVAPQKRGEGTPPPSGAALNAAASAEAFRWLVEEFRVSVFAQELGTAEPVSATKLDRALAAAKAGTLASMGIGAGAPAAIAVPAPSAGSAAAVAKPIVTAPVAEKKSAPLKNLGALDKLFPR